MSLADISYLADNLCTCLSELPRNKYDTVLIETFTIKKGLNILYLSIEPQITMECIFSRNYNYDMNG